MKKKHRSSLDILFQFDCNVVHFLRFTLTDCRKCAKIAILMTSSWKEKNK